MDHELSFAPELLEIVERALTEDIGAGDATTNSVVAEDADLNAKIIAKAGGVVAGVEVARMTFRFLDQRVRFSNLVSDGEQIRPADILAEIEGPARALLTAERTALNFLGRMSGIATLTRQFAQEVHGTKTKILDTRKTAPSLRLIDKLAVAIGGGKNHRMGLFDMILIKDNHIDFAGSITEAVRRTRSANTDLEIEVEARTLNDVAECLEARVNWIMLDNMALDEMRQAVALAAGRAKLEASGKITLKNVRAIAETGVDYISVGALTHSAPALDVSMVVNWQQ